MQIYINNVKDGIREQMLLKGIPLFTLKTPTDYYYYLDSNWLYNHAYRNHIDDAIHQLIEDCDYMQGKPIVEK